MRCAFVCVAALVLAGVAQAAGGGGSAGGSGHQRTINSGLPAGEPGPPGSPNNRRPAPATVQSTPAGSSDVVTTKKDP